MITNQANRYDSLFFMPALQEKGILWQNDVMHVQDPVRLTAIAKFNSAFFGSDDEKHPNIIEFYKTS